LYSLSLATYDKGDQFDQSAAVGFIHLWGLPVATQAQVQLIGDTEGIMGLPAPPPSGKAARKGTGKGVRKSR
jgi:hypothetical protein